MTAQRIEVPKEGEVFCNTKNVSAVTRAIKSVLLDIYIRNENSVLQPRNHWSFATRNSRKGPLDPLAPS